MKRSLLTFTIAGLASLPMFDQAYGAAIAYSETWPTTGSQATDDGLAFNNYPEWTYSERVDNAANVRVDSAGTLTLADTFTTSNTLGAVVTPTSIGTGSSTFDVSTFALTLTADVARGVNNGGTNTYNNLGVFIGDIGFLIHPGSDGGFHRVITLNNDLSQAAILQGNTNMGFSPGVDGAVSNTGFSRFEVTITEKDADEYTFSYTISDLVNVGDSYSNSIDVLKSAAGPLDRAGVRFDNGVQSSDGLFQNFSITQVPEPSTALLGAMGAFALLRRRR